MRYSGILAAVLAFAAPAAAAEPPPALAPYVEDGALRAGDYGWVRGAFADASSEDKVAYQSIVAWRDACSAAAREDVRAELVALGAALPDDGMAYGGPLLCRVAYPPKLDAIADYAGLEAAGARVFPLFESYMAAAKLAEEFAASSATTLGDRLLARRIGDQVLRRGLILAATRSGPFAGLDDAEHAVLFGLMNDAALAHDLTNTEWLKAHVAEHGWPTVSEVGARGANTAWLLAQHSDLDPAFQLRALRLMEPLAAAGEADRANFAFLSDRLSLKLAGTQRYGSQLVCRSGTREPMPLEDPARVDALRAEFGLGTLAGYVASMNARGPC